MRKVTLVAFILGTLGLLSLARPGTAAPNPGEKPVRYEYAELQFSRSFGGPPGGWPAVGAPLPPAVAGPGGPGVGFPPPALAPAPGMAANTTIRWTTAEEQVEVKEWSELADKLKAAEPKKESPATVHKLRVLNKLSADGWEVMDRPLFDSGSPGTVAFRRRLP